MPGKATAGDDLAKIQEGLSKTARQQVAKGTGGNSGRRSGHERVQKSPSKWI